MLVLLKPIIPCLRIYLHDYIPARTRKRNPPEEYLSFAKRAMELGDSGLAGLCKKVAVAINEQRTLIKEDFELYPDKRLEREEIITHIRDYYLWQNYSFVRDMPNGVIYRQNRTLRMTNVTFASEKAALVTVFEFRCGK